MNALTNGQYSFIETGVMSQERINFGWAVQHYPAYVKKYFENEQNRLLCRELIDAADVVIIGNAPEELIKNRLKIGKLIFRYSERIYKNGFQWYKLPKRMIGFYLKFTRYKNQYLLCASAYTAADFAKTGAFINKAYKWGYFPEAKQYNNIENLIRQKEPVSILWAARLIDWKHPEAAIDTAKHLKKSGYSFKLRMIGTGPLKNAVDSAIAENNLCDCVELMGPMSPDQVRKHMEESEIFIATSDFREGWGAVLNESLNSACAVVASHAMGSVPLLIKDRDNGLIYENGNTDDLFQKVKYMLDHDRERQEMGLRAYQSITEQWNAENAAARFIQLAEAILNGNKRPDLFEYDVCSKAGILKNGWYKTHE